VWEGLAALLGLTGSVVAIGLIVASLRRARRQGDLPSGPETIARRTFVRAYPVLLLGVVSGMALGGALAHHRGIALYSTSGLMWVFGGTVIGLIPGTILLDRGRKAYQRALDEHYAGTRWARHP
jgi:hypothetical protein